VAADLRAAVKFVPCRLFNNVRAAQAAIVSPLIFSCPIRHVSCCPLLGHGAAKNVTTLVSRVSLALALLHFIASIAAASGLRRDVAPDHEAASCNLFSHLRLAGTSTGGAVPHAVLENMDSGTQTILDANGRIGDFRLVKVYRSSAVFTSDRCHGAVTLTLTNGVSGSVAPAKLPSIFQSHGAPSLPSSTSDSPGSAVPLRLVPVQ
jgi:hypothetical protein